MNADDVDRLLHTVRRQMALARAARVGLIVLGAAAIWWAANLPDPRGRYATFLVAMGVVLGWVGVFVRSMRSAREVQAGSILLSAGQLDDAETWLRKAATRFSLTLGAKLLACQELASLMLRREAYAEAAAICREVLRHRMRRARGVLVNARLMLADVLLLLNRVEEAYAAIRPLYDESLSLAERMRLLPIQLRYELAADHAASAVSALEEKVRIAELLDSRRAALVHALLAEACRRQAMPAQRGFLIERARLYHDLDPLAERYGVIAPVVKDDSVNDAGERQG